MHEIAAHLQAAAISSANSTAIPERMNGVEVEEEKGKGEVGNRPPLFFSSFSSSSFETLYLSLASWAGALRSPERWR